MSSKIKVFIVDDHKLLVDGIRSLLSTDDQIEVVGTAYNGNELLQKLNDIVPDVLLMDINMPELDGVKTLQSINSSDQKIKTLIISSHNDSRLVREIWKIGAQGYILKSNSSDEELIRAIKIIHFGGDYYSQEIKEKLKKVSSERQNNNTNTAPVLPISLTKREREILKLIAMEYRTTEISKELFISSNTVETHKKNLFRKLGVKGIAGLVKYAVKHDFI